MNHRMGLLVGFLVGLAFPIPAVESPEEKYFGTDAFVPDWRAAEEIDRKATERFLEQHWPKFKKRYDQGGNDSVKDVSAEGKKAGAVAFVTSYMQEVLPDFMPGAEEMAVSKIRLFAARGESEPFLLGVRTLGKSQEISIQPDDLKMGDEILSREDITVRLRLPYEAKIKTGRNGREIIYADKMQSMVMIRPPDGKWKFPKNYSLAYMVDIHVPLDTKPGLYQGEVRVLSGEKIIKTIPMELEVLPFSLKTNNFHAGAFGISYRRFPGGFLGYYPEMMEMDSRYGFNLAGGFFNKGEDIPFKKGTSPLEIDVESEKFIKFNEIMQLLKKHGMGQVAFWNWGASGNVEHFNHILDGAGFSKINTPGGKKGFAEICRTIKAAEKAYGWPELVINPYDEALDDPASVKEIIHAMSLVSELSPETRIYMTEWHRGFTRLYQSKGNTLSGKKTPGDDDYQKIPESEAPQLNFHVIGSNNSRDDSRAIQDQLGGEYWCYGAATKVSSQPRFLYGFQSYMTRAEASLIWANYRGSLLGTGWTVNFIISDDPTLDDEANEKPKGSTRGLVIPSVRALIIREGIDDRKYIETLKYHAKKKSSEEDLAYLRDLQVRCRKMGSLKDLGGRENVEANIAHAEEFQSIRGELKERILKLQE